MTTYRPDWQGQGPATNCIVNGKAIGWLSCTCYATAMLIDRATLGRKQPSGCAVRRGTGDTVNGTTLRQCADVARDDYDVAMTVRAGSNVIRPSLAAAQLKSGRPLVLQGNASAMLGTSFRSTNGPVNHAVYLNEGRDWDDDIPEEVLVYDPAADGRRDGIDQGPSWWPWSLVLKFGAALEPNGDGTPKLGPGWWYCAIGPDTGPDVILRFGGVETVPLPDRTRAEAEPKKVVNVRSAPFHNRDNVVRHLVQGELFKAWQITSNGSSFKGSRRWYGNQAGSQWVHSSRLSHKGGST